MSANRIQIGIWQSIPQPMVSRYLAQMGWDWVILDMQHGPMNWETAYECIHTLRASGARPLVRTAIGATDEVEKALDLGAGGVVVPMVNTVETARVLARAAKYPPLGGRSLGGDNFLHYGADYPEKANTDTLLLVQMEHIEAVQNADQIMALPGVDGCFVGPVDLALSMGIDRHTYEQHPDHRAAMQRIVEATLAAGKLPCCNTYSPDDFAAKQEAGFRAITLRSDMDLLVGGGRDLLGRLEKIAAGR